MANPSDSERRNGDRAREPGSARVDAVERSLLEGSSDIVLEADGEGRILWGNRAAQAFFGRHLAGLSVHWIFRHSDRVTRCWERFLAGGASEEVESCWHRGADQADRLLRWRFLRLAALAQRTSAVWLAAIDVTGAADAIEDPAKGGLRRLGAAGVTMVWELELQQRPEKTRGDLVIALGLDFSASLRGEAWMAYLHPQDTEIFSRFVDDLVRGVDEEIFCKFRGRVIAGNYRWFALSGRVTTRDGVGMPQRAIGTARDLTSQHRAEEEQTRRDARALQFQKMEAIGELAGGIAHDFNNTLTTIMGYTELALLEVDHAHQHKLTTYLREVYQGGRRARDLISKMLLFSRREEAHPVRASVTELIESSVRMLRATLPASVTISVDCDPRLPDVRVDPALMHLMMINLCVNASDAMQGVGVIYVRARLRTGIDRLCASCHDRFAGDLVELAVEDSGPGIRPEVEARIFEPYMSTKQTGSGMGLAVVHGILHQQRGHLLVDTLVGDGTEFRLYFPPLPPAEASDRSEEIAPIRDLVDDPANRDRHILVVDDEPALRDFLMELFERQGYRVTSVVDGSEAWEVCRSHPDRFDLVVTDQAMPGITGVQLAERLGALRPRLPIILCTSYSEIVSSESARTFGISGYIAKPIDTRKLLDLVDRELNKPH